MRNVLAVVPKDNSEMVAAAIRTVFAQPDAARVSEQFDTGAVLVEQHDEWAAADRYFSERSMALLVPDPKAEGQVATPELMTGMIRTLTPNTSGNHTTRGDVTEGSGSPPDSPQGSECGEWSVRVHPNHPGGPRLGTV